MVDLWGSSGMSRLIVKCCFPPSSSIAKMFFFNWFFGYPISAFVIATVKLAAQSKRSTIFGLDHNSITISHDSPKSRSLSFKSIYKPPTHFHFLHFPSSYRLSHNLLSTPPWPPSLPPSTTHTSSNLSFKTNKAPMQIQIVSANHRPRVLLTTLFPIPPPILCPPHMIFFCSRYACMQVRRPDFSLDSPNL